MNNKIIAFLLGFILVGGAMIAVILILARPAPIVSTPEVKTLTSEDLNKAKELTGGLENLGNLPYTITADQIGRANPFESY